MNKKFQNQKLIFLSKKDKSSKKEIDKAILPLIKKLNSKKNYYTTSSCAGRIILLKEKDKKQKNAFLFVTHNEISIKDLKKALWKSRVYNGLVYFQQEPCILHVVCSSIEAAKELVKKARSAGWKKSGIVLGKKTTCELISTEHMAMPIALTGRILIDDDYMELLVKEADKKLKRTREKIKKLAELV